MDEEKRRYKLSRKEEVVIIRNRVREMGKSIGFEELALAELETVATEIGTNLVKYGSRGEVTLSIFGNGSFKGVELLSRDNGPGIDDLPRALAGDNSTWGSLGAGLSGVTRMVDEFLIQSGQGAPTALTIRKWAKAAPVKYGGLIKPFPGEKVSGDAFFVKRYRDFDLMAAIDGLGHGEGAHTANQLCCKLLEDHGEEELEQLTARCHRELHKSRGVAMSIARICHSPLRLCHVSIGNVESRVYNTAETIRPLCYNGTLGMAMKKNRITAYPLEPGAIIIMASDGIKSRFAIRPEQFHLEPAAIATEVFREYVRGNDDATVLVARVQR